MSPSIFFRAMLRHKDVSSQLASHSLPNLNQALDRLRAGDVSQVCVRLIAGHTHPNALHKPTKAVPGMAVVPSISTSTFPSSLLFVKVHFLFCDPRHKTHAVDKTEKK